MSGLAIFGVTGRMGQSLIRALGETDLVLSGAVASRDSGRLGQDADAGGMSGIRITGDPALGVRGAAVAADFSRAEFVAEHAAACMAAGVPLLVGTTGFDDAAAAALEAAARRIAVLIAPNTSVGVAVMGKIVALAAAALGPEYDVEIAEAHHRLKRDAPSGTALALGAAVSGVRGRPLSEVAVFDRHGRSQLREPGSIGFSVLRAGDIVGEHSVVFAGPGERLEITHRAADRMIFARGALRAARWLVGRPAGRYTMQNVLGL